MQGHRDADGPAVGKPTRVQQGSGCRPRTAKGEDHRNGNGDRRRHAVRDAGTIGRGWQVALADDTQVVRTLH